MLKLYSYDIVFSEIPNEVTLAINISGCPYRCHGCHSEWLREDTGEILNESLLEFLLGRYGSSVTCVCFMGGDNDPKAIEKLAGFVKQKAGLMIGWYSGSDSLPNNFSLTNFDYIKLGKYIEHLGGINSPKTNQRFYRVENGEIIDKTSLFKKVTY